MPRTIRCTQCGVTLNLPPEAIGRRLKCPKCGHKFASTPADANAASSASGVANVNLDSMVGPRRPNEAPIPKAEGDLRDTFDLPMMTEAASTEPTRQMGDALALFNERPVAPRRKGAAEARASARRCPTCGGVVPVGMSICPTCGLDLETGALVGLEDEFAPVARSRPGGPPLGVVIVGGLCLLGSIALGTILTAEWLRGYEGAQYLALVCAFAIFASVHFLRGKSVRLLLVALTLGAAISVVAFIALPIYHANATPKFVPRTELIDPDDQIVAIQPIVERLDTQRISLGVVALVLYAGVSIYLMSPAVRRHISHRSV